MPTSVAVLVPRETDQPLDGIDAFEEAFGGHVGEVLAKGITRPVTVAEQVADRGVTLIGDQGSKGGRLLCKVENPTGIGLPVASLRPPRGAVVGSGCVRPQTSGRHRPHPSLPP